VRTDTVPAVPDVDMSGPVHHIMRPRQFTAAEYAEALAGLRPAEALCGVVRFVHPRPLELPACGMCESIRQVSS
jgi:hypothetical protein